MASRWCCITALFLASLACGRSHLSVTGPADSGESADALGAADVAPRPDASTTPDSLAPSSPDRVPDLDLSICGNDRVDPGEECDDGNVLAGDGCDSTCKVECDWEPCWEPPPIVSICGNGIVSAIEACDDGNVQPGDGCSEVCLVEPGFRCTVPGKRCTPVCGDGRVVGTETCDDGNTESWDGCSEFCLTEPCWDCSSGACEYRDPVVDGGPCQYLSVAYCGDGVLQGAEECDDGAQNNDGEEGRCSTHCRYLRCGDGVLTSPEECDLGWANNTAVYGDRGGCTRDCTLAHYCGDGIVDAADGEQCDEHIFPCTGDCVYVLY
jgi:cysteine-rich repeat protein